MIQQKLHPNTHVIIEAWKSLSGGDTTNYQGPMAQDHADLVSQLFILRQYDENDYSISSAGEGLADIFGHDLTDHNFLSLWMESDRKIVQMALDYTLDVQEPTLLRVTAMSLNGTQNEVEISLSPLESKSGKPNRVLVLYQNTGADLRRPVWRHHIDGFEPLITKRQAPAIRLVANNN
jgi:hypothetical protein